MWTNSTGPALPCPGLVPSGACREASLVFLDVVSELTEHRAPCVSPAPGAFPSTAAHMLTCLSMGARESSLRLREVGRPLGHPANGRWSHHASWQLGLPQAGYGSRPAAHQSPEAGIIPMASPRAAAERREGAFVQPCRRARGPPRAAPGATRGPLGHPGRGG